MSFASFPSDDEIHDLLRRRIDVHRRAIGGIIGIVDASGPRTIAYGRAARDGAPVSADTLFELGCVSKVLTGLLCAEMIGRGEVGLADAIGGDLPAHVPSVGRNGVPIAIEHLVTHTSGLPHHVVDVYDPIERVFDLLCARVPAQDVGAFYEYSTAGYAVLGYVLERRGGAPHAALVRERILEPLGMTDTVVEVPRESATRIAAGHDAGLRPLGPFPTPTVTGGYGFHSTAADLLRLVAACAGLVVTPLLPAIDRTVAIRRRGAPGVEDIGMAWHLSTLNGRDAVLHDGSSFGHRAFVGYTRGGRRGLVALVNAVTPIGITDIARHLLNPHYPILPDDAVLLRPARDSMAAGGRAGPLDRFAGLYQLTPNCRLIVACDGSDLSISDGRECRRLVRLGEGEFWLPATGFRSDGVVRFDVDGHGRPVAMTVPDRGFLRRLVRVDGDPAPMWHGRRAAADPPLALERYAGRYQFGDFVLDVRYEGGRLRAGWTSSGSPAASAVTNVGGTGRPDGLLHEDGHRFFFESDRFDTALTFEPGGDGRIVAVTCTMNQRTERGIRMPAIVA